MNDVVETKDGDWSFQEIGRKLEHVGRWCGPDRLAWGLIGLGILLRLAQYAANRSLWYDEVSLASNIVKRSLAGLLQPLDSDQGAPLGFLVLAKLAVQSLGSSEYALRLVPLIGGILSLFLFWWVARQVLRREAVPIAVGLFAILGPLVYYSSEVKQYSTDVAAALFVFGSAQPLFDARVLSARQAFLIATIGAISLWFSHPTLFVLMGVGTAALVRCCRGRDWERARRLAIVALVWVLSLALFYYVSLRHLQANRVLLDYWRTEGAFLPLPLSLATVQWLAATFLRVLEFPVGLPSRSEIGALALLVGIVSFSTRRGMTLLALLAPLAFTLGASALRLYPFGDRLLLFAVPFLVLLIAEGMRYMTAASWRRAPLVSVLLAGALFFYPAWSAAGHLIRPRLVEEIKPVMAYLRAHLEPGDTVYVQADARNQFSYYSGRYGFVAGGYVGGVWERDVGWKRFVDELDQFRGTRRLWIVLSHIHEEGVFALNYLDSQGTRRDAFVRPGSAVYLYDLSKRTSRSP